MRKPAPSPQEQDPIVAPHPLAAQLIERLRGSQARNVLEFASGRERNARALRSAKIRVVCIADTVATSPAPFAGIAERFDAILSTHGLLHGTAATVGDNVRSMAQLLHPGGLLYATFGSTRDGRFGVGTRLDNSTFAPLDGDERGVPHAYFDRHEVLAMLEPFFDMETLTEQDVDAVAGSWAHREKPLQHAVHWFAIARKR